MKNKSNKMPRERKSNLKAKSSMMEPGMDNPPGPTKSKKRRSLIAMSAINTQGNQVNSNQMVNQSSRTSNTQGDLVPPPPSNAFGETLIAANPFDDTPCPSNTPSQSTPSSNFKGNSNQNTKGGPQTPNPSSNQSQMRINNQQRRPSSVGHQPLGSNINQPMNNPNQGKPVQIMSGKVYPADTPVVVNPQNRNQPPIYTCGVCHKEVNENDQALLCESGCNFWYHRACTGLSEYAFHLLNVEVYVEWVCDNCLSSKEIPLVKFKP